MVSKDFSMLALKVILESREVTFCLVVVFSQAFLTKANGKLALKDWGWGGYVPFRSVLVCFLTVCHCKPGTLKGMELDNRRKHKEKRWGLERSIC